jgi:FAD/FMN-containing dehydrogenase
MSEKYSRLSETHIRNLSAAVAGKVHLGSEGGLETIENNYRPVKGRIGGKAGLVIFPQTTEQVAEVLKYCNKHKIKVFTQGGNSGLVGGSTPDDSGESVVLKTTKMDKVLTEINDDISSVKTQAGVIIDALNEKLAAVDLFCSIKHGGTGSATTGGNAATNSGGENAIKYGVTRDQVIGLTVVTPTGEILKLGGNAKDTANSIMHKFIGSEGALGVITEVELKVYNKPKNLQTALITFDDIKNITPFLAKLKKEFGKDGIESFEFMNNFIFSRSCKITNGADALGLPADKAAYVIFEVSSSAKNEDMLERVIGFLEQNQHLIDFNNSIPATDGNSRSLFWAIREHCTDASKEFSGANAVRFDTCVPLDKVAASVVTTEQKLRAQLSDGFSSGAVQYGAFGHWGDGNIHIHVVQDKETIVPLGQIVLDNEKNIEKTVFNYQVRELGGTGSAEHGFGRITSKFMYYPAAVLKQILQDKESLDPNNILNPGIAVPTKEQIKLIETTTKNLNPNELV